MPNAAATFDDDFGRDAPARRTAPRKSRAATGSKKRKKGRRRFEIDMHKVARWAAVGMSASLAFGIMVNALMLQKSRHPAPLFGNGITLSARPAPAPAPRVMPLPLVEPSLPATEPVPMPIPAPRQRHANDDAPSGDAIARLLQGSSPSAADGDKADSKTIAGVQKALAKLGFSVKSNGTFGPATHKAIESFEKDRHLPVKGELTKRIVKIISAESGVKID